MYKHAQHGNEGRIDGRSFAAALFPFFLSFCWRKMVGFRKCYLFSEGKFPIAKRCFLCGKAAAVLRKKKKAFNELPTFLGKI